MLEEIRNISTRSKDLRSFGITIGMILLVIAVFLLFKEKNFYQIFFYIAFTFIGLGILIPIILKPIYIVWMVFAVILGWIMTRIILSLLFYAIITPIGIIMRVAGKDFLKLKLSGRVSYWNQRNNEVELNQDYEKQF